MVSPENLIQFSTDEVELPIADLSVYEHWLTEVAIQEGKEISKLSYTFCSDDRLLEINQQFLKHDYYTDIITFPYSYEPIESDVYISIDRVKENANNNKVSFEEELKRVIVHGLLHMCGYGDKSEEEQVEMRSKESHYIAAFK